MPGDQILAVNGNDLRTVTQDYAAELLKVLSVCLIVMDYVCMFTVLPTFLILSSMIGFETSVAMPPDLKFLKFLLFCFENYQIFVMEQKVL